MRFISREYLDVFLAKIFYLHLHSNVSLAWLDRGQHKMENATYILHRRCYVNQIIDGELEMHFAILTDKKIYLV